MSIFVPFESRWINVAERSRSIFSLVVSCSCAGEDFSPPFDDADEDYQWEI
jgi:hypothetical protein